MTAAEMRVRLVARYPDSKAWAARVNRMSDHQVIAIFLRINTQRPK